jgi:hypothetical protein
LNILILANIFLHLKVKLNHKFYGITQDPETNNYMIVLGGMCEKCNRICNSIYFQRNFKNWTSRNNHIDKFIQCTQLLAHYNVEEALEWIPYDRLYDIEYIVKNEFNDIHRAIWIDGYINRQYDSEMCWDDDYQNWERENHNMSVKLKILITPKDLTLKFTNKV